ncbi:MAG: hypothetical protein ACRC7O_03655, partial [Fimbriiglobus sp.]
MTVPMLNEQLAQVVRRWVYRIRKPAAPPAARRRPTLRLEEYEARLVPASLPAVTVDTGSIGSVASGVSPSAAYNPANPDQAFMATSDGTNVFYYSSINGGQAWTLVFDTVQRSGGANAPIWSDLRGGRMIDPAIDPQGRFEQNRVYTVHNSPTVGIARDGTVYVTSRQANGPADDANSGAIVVHKFQFPVTGGDAELLDLDDAVIPEFGGDNSANLLYRWLGQDPAFHPTVGVDNSIPSVTDPTTIPNTKQSTTFVDPITGAPKAVYFAWNTNASTPSADAEGFTPNIIVASISTDGAESFSNPLPVTGGGGFSSPYFQGFIGDQAVGATAPKIVISGAGADRQGFFTGSAPGRLTFLWNGVNS